MQDGLPNDRKPRKPRGPMIPKPKTLNLISFLLLTIASSASAVTIPLDSVVALVDDDVIMKSEVDERFRSIKQQLLAQKTAMPSDSVMIKQILDRLIIESIQLQMAERAGVRISDEELNQTMGRIAEQNNFSLAQFQAALEADGISYPDMRHQIRRELLISQVQQGVMRNRIQISDQEIKAFLESELGQTVTSDEYRIAHILLATPEDASLLEIQEVERETLEVLEQIRQGADFQRLAIAKSAGQQALEGGDLGWRKAVQLPSLFADIVQTMDVGALAGPIKSGSGFHLIKLVQKRGAKAQGQVKQTRVRHILVQPSEIRSKQETLELSTSILEELESGRDFAELAKLHSEDPSSTLSGGDLGWNQAGTFVPEFEDVMNALEVNQISEVFESSHGFHILEVTGRRVEDFSEEFKRNQAANYLTNQKFDEELQTWLREIREDSFIEMRIES